MITTSSPVGVGLGHAVIGGIGVAGEGDGVVFDGEGAESGGRVRGELGVGLVNIWFG